MGDKDRSEHPWEHLAAELPIEVRDALQHPLRRQMLRALDGGTRRLNAAELAKSFPVPCSVATASYHLSVLARSGLLERAGSESDGGAKRQYFGSGPARSPDVRRILSDTEQPDQLLLEDATEAHA